MLKLTKFHVYEYPIKHKDGSTYFGSYTIQDGAKPVGFKDEKLVQTFKANVKYTPA